MIILPNDLVSIFIKLVITLSQTTKLRLYQTEKNLQITILNFEKTAESFPEG